jgi:hypothetical protein
MTYRSIHPPNSAIDEALWAAYRRDDKAAVTDYLFRNWLVAAISPAGDQRQVGKVAPRGAHTTDPD